MNTRYGVLMANTTETVRSTSILPTALLITFIVLKLTGVIAWSWVWVLSPLWIPLVVALIISIIGAIVVIMIGGLRNDRRWP
ncbi:hypothetical protein KNU02_gp05 [Gordonia phage Pleakley]|uniref:Uncharacterized protein n=1 Tax=Gordonia phage Pleakley TaxID=2283246 RepID=A0A345M6C3_9CAUD|nr:hypothetical protein KNU02_gp05 [Gordonia phage Pleakley]AXH49731.1 hypothetical protein SEA_FURY_5 [Gordonia phage Fury]AXH66044.1 hypothetical protein SEA_PLEAKLEY_5 [Gordonia phage Pleakley]